MDLPASFKRIPEKKKVKRKESDVPTKKKKSDTFEPIKKKTKKDSEKAEKSEKKKDKNDKSFADGKKIKKEPQDMHSKIIQLSVKDRYAEELNDQSSSIFKKCVEKFTPVSKYIKKLSKSVKDDDSDFYRYLMKLGDHITSQVEDMAASSTEISTEQDKWNSYMWIFLSRFSSQNPIELHAKYEQKALAKVKNHHHESKHHHHNSLNSSSSHRHQNEIKSPLKESSSTDKLSRLSNSNQNRRSDNNSFFKRPK
uniref:Chromodomain-helicase-DNA-binding protein 1-like C-terminal domain-containing protein n=1 Tax=Panagrolaimus sp. ES5 TaxID=591445 RepID=A0AC34FVV7_9BILA